MKLIILASAILCYICVCAAQDYDRHHGGGGWYSGGDGYYHNHHQRPHYPPHHRPYGSWRYKRGIHVHDISVANVLFDLDTKLGKSCTAILVCEATFDPKLFGHFGEDLPLYSTTGLSPLDPLLKAFSLGSSVKDFGECRRELGVCALSDLELKQKVEKYYA